MSVKLNFFPAREGFTKTCKKIPFLFIEQTVLFYFYGTETLLGDIKWKDTKLMYDFPTDGRSPPWILVSFKLMGRTVMLVY